MISILSKTQYLQVVGLLSLARQANQQLREIESAIRAVLEVTETDNDKSGIGDPDHIGDALYSDYSPQDLIRKLGLNVPVLWITENAPPED